MLLATFSSISEGGKSSKGLLLLSRSPIKTLIARVWIFWPTVFLKILSFVSFILRYNGSFKSLNFPLWQVRWLFMSVLELGAFLATLSLPSPYEYVPLASQG
jgi:hypothetical protein